YDDASRTVTKLWREGTIICHIQAKLFCYGNFKVPVFYFCSLRSGTLPSTKASVSLVPDYEGSGNLKKGCDRAPNHNLVVELMKGICLFRVDLQCNEWVRSKLQSRGTKPFEFVRTVQCHNSTKTAAMVHFPLMLLCWKKLLSTSWIFQPRRLSWLAAALEDALDVDDLEVDKRPEEMRLSYVSGEKGKDRSDRELVTPWFKFL
ncbi:eukaryotic translation initiation factor 3 subunit A-like protein, partial [Tanacetum coccineum]